jgi:hypothetical protein
MKLKQISVLYGGTAHICFSKGILLGSYLKHKKLTHKNNRTDCRERNVMTHHHQPTVKIADKFSTDVAVSNHLRKKVIHYCFITDDS